MSDTDNIAQYKKKWEKVKMEYAKFHPEKKYKPNLVSRPVVAQMLDVSSSMIVKMFTKESAVYLQGKVPKEAYEPFLYKASELDFKSARLEQVYDLNACMAWRLENEIANKAASKDRLSAVKEKREQLELDRELRLHIHTASVNDDFIPKIQTVVERLYHGVSNTYLMANGMENDEGLKLFHSWLDKTCLDLQAEFKRYAQMESDGDDEKAQVVASLERLD